jgi:hypothetical protein
MLLQGPMCGELSNNFEIFRVLIFFFYMCGLLIIIHCGFYGKNPFIKMCRYKGIYEKWPKLLGTTNKWDFNMPNYPWHM